MSPPISGEPAPARAATDTGGAQPAAAEAVLRVCLLGAPRLAWSDGRVHTLQRRDAALLTMLVLDGPAPRSRVAMQLWPDADPEGARNNLRQRLFRLRRTAARDVVSADDVLRLADGIGHDLEPPSERSGEAPQAAAELLGGLDYADCAELGDWVDGARERWRTARSQALAAIAGVREVVLATPADAAAAKAWDLSLIVRFDALTDVKRYLADPAHIAYYEGFLEPRLQVIKAWNFEV